MRKTLMSLVGALCLVVLLAPLTVDAQNVVADADTLYLMSPQEWAAFNNHIALAVVSDNPGVVEGRPQTGDQVR